MVQSCVKWRVSVFDRQAPTHTFQVDGLFICPSNISNASLPTFLPQDVFSLFSLMIFCSFLKAWLNSYFESYPLITLYSLLSLPLPILSALSANKSAFVWWFSQIKAAKRSQFIWGQVQITFVVNISKCHEIREHNTSRKSTLQHLTPQKINQSKELKNRKYLVSVNIKLI